MARGPGAKAGKRWEYLIQDGEWDEWRRKAALVRVCGGVVGGGGGLLRVLLPAVCLRINRPLIMILMPT